MRKVKCIWIPGTLGLCPGCPRTGASIIRVSALFSRVAPQKLFYMISIQILSFIPVIVQPVENLSRIVHAAMAVGING